MIRVFSTYYYRGQNIFTVNDNIITSCLLDCNHIIVAKSNHIIEILTLLENDVNHNDANDLNVNVSFPTVDQVQQMCYCINGNYIVTIESRSARRQNEKFYCRVYTNWNAITDSSGYNVSIRARIANKVTPTNNHDCLEVIEIPVKSPPTQVACCQMTGNIIVAMGNTIVFYKLVACYNDNTKYQYIDFKEIPFYVELEFIPTKITICEHCICALSSDFVYLFKIVVTNTTESDDMISANSFTSDISNNGSGSMGQKSFACVDFNEKRPDDWMVVISSTSDNNDTIQRNASLSEHRPINIEMGCVLKRLTGKGFDSLNCNKEYSTKTMLKIRPKDARDPFKQIFIKPIYMDRNEHSDNDTTPSSLDHILKSNYHNSFVGLAALVATTNDGYLYQFTNNDKWITEDNNFVATYPFTSPAISVAINDYVIQILTDRGIETYTHRIGHKLFSNSYEYNLKDDQFPIETCPRIDEPICLIGLRHWPGLGVHTMHCTNTNLVLLANSLVNASGGGGQSSDKMDLDTSWTVYNLILPQPEMLFKDFEELSKTYINECRSTYLHLMSEAHMIMRVATEFYQIQQHEQKAILSKYTSPDCVHIYLDSCRKLGDFCVLSSNKEEYCLAFPYYTMGKISIDNLYDRVQLLNQTASKSSFIGFIHTMKNMLINCHDPSEYIGRLLTTVRSNKFVSLGEELIEIFLIYAPNDISVLTLRSQVFREYMSSKVCEAINSKQHKTDVDNLCLILEYVSNSNTKEATDILNTLTESQLFVVLVEYWNVLFDFTHIKKTGKRVTTFSELTEAYLLSSSNPTIRICITNIFIYLMIDTKVISIDLLLKLLMDYLAAHVGQNGYVTAQLILQELLESYYYHMYALRHFTGTNSDQSVILESITTTTTTSSSGVKCSQNQHHPSGSGSAPTADSCAIEHFYCDSIQNEAMKILIRIYLGKLKKIRIVDIAGQQQSLYNQRNHSELFKFMRQNLSKLFEHHQNYNENHFPSIGDVEQLPLPSSSSSIHQQQRPILFLEKRSQFLNSMDPFKAIELRDENTKFDVENVIEHFNEIQLTVIKFQALLCSGKLTRDIIQEIVYFFEANMPLIGMDSFISILLPMTNCIEFFIEQHPELLLLYAKSRIIFDKDWLEFLTLILDKKESIIKRHTLQCYENILTEILQYIVTSKRLVQVFKILPTKDDTSSIATEDSLSDIDEEMLFTEYLSMAIDRDRAERLGDMIKTTGHQLYDTYNKNKQFFN